MLRHMLDPKVALVLKLTEIVIRFLRHSPQHNLAMGGYPYRICAHKVPAFLKKKLGEAFLAESPKMGRKCRFPPLDPSAKNASRCF